MSKISYCSLEEAWGESFKKDDMKDVQTSMNAQNKLERDDVIKNMNSVERIPKNTNNTSSEFEKYRFNTTNTVSEDSAEKIYTPFNESIEKKYLQDKLAFLENEFKKHNFLNMDTDTSTSTSTNSSYSNLENFNNVSGEERIHVQKSYGNSNSNDIFDLIFLIIIGLIIIFIMNSIFKIGKSIGARS